jgi:hypothetical protein
MRERRLRGFFRRRPAVVEVALLDIDDTGAHDDGRQLRKRPDWT